jgi:hypothetical protein
MNSDNTGGNTQTKNAPAAGPAQPATARRQIRVNELLGDREGTLPVWVRSPKSGVERHSGFSRSKLYELAGNGRIRSVSIREPGQIKGTRLFHLESILAYIEKCEAEAMAEAGS